MSENPVSVAVLRTARKVVRGHSTDGSFVLDVVLPVSKLPVISSSALPNFVLRLRSLQRAGSEEPGPLPPPTSHTDPNSRNDLTNNFSSCDFQPLDFER
jgi:hypothetical protein